MKNLEANAWLALAVLTAVMALLLFVPAGTVHYGQGWLYLGVFAGVSTLITLDLIRKDPALLARRMKGGPTAEKQPNQKLIMLGMSIGFIALLVVPALDHHFRWSAVPVGGVVAGDALVATWLLSDRPRVSSEHVLLGDHRNRRESEDRLDRTIRPRSPSNVRERDPVSSWHAARAWLVLGVGPAHRDDAISDLAAPRRGALPRQESTRIY